MGKNTIKRIVKNVKTKAQTLNTARKLNQQSLNPKALAGVAKGAIKGEGVVLPGSKYIGPGNKMNKGKPNSKADAYAFQHDIDYDDYIKAGVKPSKVYTRYSDADDRLRKRSQQHATKDPHAMATYLGMSAKKKLHDWGVVGKVRDREVYGSRMMPQTPNQYQKISNQYLSEA